MSTSPKALRCIGKRGLSAGGSLFVLTCLMLASTDASTAGQEQSRRLFFEQPPAWTVSGAWAPDGTLLLVDTLNSKVLRYDLQGSTAELAGALKGPSGGELSFLKPSIIKPIPEGYLLEDEDAHFIFLNSSLDSRKPLKSIDLLEASNGAIRSVFGWTYFDSTLLALSDLREGERSSAFVRVPLDDPERFEVVQPLPVSASARSFYLMGNPYFATVNDQAFFLRMDAVPALYNVTGSGTTPRLVGRYSGLGLPALPDRSTAQGIKSGYDILERTPVVTGLYASNGYLYLLARQPQWREGWQWGLSKIDPLTGKQLRTLSLPSPARHLVVIPGDKYWAFVEKGPVRALGQQDVDSVYLVPTETIESANP
jgi:hypothetical protein